jgi:hypothetical protein
MVRKVFPIWFVGLALFVGLVMTACRDIDEPPPLPVFDPNAPLDGGTDAEGGLAGLTISSCAQSVAA